MGYKHGLRNRFYVSATLHEDETPITWSEADLTESVGHEDARDEAEIVNRRGEFAVYGVGKRKAGYTLKMTYDPADAAFAIIWAAYQNGTMIAIADMDGDITVSGTKGTYMDVVVLSAPKPEDLTAFDSIEFVFKPAAMSTHEPEFVTIAGATTTTGA